MSDALLSQMSQAAREHILADVRWEGYARGTLEPADEADLLARARAAGLDEETIAAFKPRDAALHDALVDIALGAMAKRPSPVGRPATSPAARGRRRSPAAIFVGAGAALAAAAAMLLVLRRGDQLPEYAMELEGGTSDQRSSPGDPGGVVKVGPDSRLAITLRPSARATRQIAARAHLFGGPGGARPVRAPAEIAESGSVRIAAPASDLFAGAAAGTWELCVAVGDPSRLPDPTITGRPAERGDGFVTVCRPIEWVGPE